MQPELVGWLVIGILFLLLALRAPIAIAVGIPGLLGIWILQGSGPAFAITGILSYFKVAYYPFTVIPLFILMGYFAHYAGFTEDIFRTGQLWVGRFPGGLVQATIFGAAGFGACCGSGVASCATVGKVAIPPMLKMGVDKRMAYGAVAAAGTIAVMIPPSVAMVMYGVITEQSVGKLLIAGIFPGIIAAFWYMVMVYVRCKRNPALAPSLEARVSWLDRLKALKGTWGIIALATLVMGGIYTGIFTPTEAGAIGCFGAFVAAIALRRLRWDDLREALLGTMKTTGMAFLIVVCVFILTNALSVSRIPSNISEFIIGLEMPRIVILIGIMVFYLVLGTFMELIAALFITLPIFLPVIINLGYDPIWFGVLVVHTMEVSWITPPFGMNLFVLKSVVPDADLKDIIMGIGPYLLMDMVTLATYIAFPAVALFLPGLMMGS